MLLLAGGDDRHNPLGETTSGLALSTEAALTPKHSGTDLPFTQVVSRFYTFNVHEGPQGILTFEDIPAGASRALVIAVGPLAQQFAYFVLNRWHVFLEDGAAHGSIPNLMPPLKHQLGLSE
jgi:hypothetical protein